MSFMRTKNQNNKNMFLNEPNRCEMGAFMVVDLQVPDWVIKCGSSAELRQSQHRQQP